MAPPERRTPADPWLRAVLAAPLLLALLLAASGCGPRKQGDEGPNRAGLYCETLGYAAGFSVVEGKSVRVCRFSAKRQCELWDFYYGRCGNRYSKCETKGFIVRPRVERLPKGEVAYAVCLFDDGSECVEQDFLEGRCKRTECKKWSFAQGGCVRAQSG